MTVTFDGNGGSVPETSRNAVYNSTYGELPIPTKAGHRFTGWFTAPSCGMEVTEATRHTYIMDATFYAQWRINNYTISFVSNRGTGVDPLTQELTHLSHSRHKLRMDINSIVGAAIQA